MMRFMKWAAGVAVLLVALSLISGCASRRDRHAYVERPVEQLYNAATDRLERRRYTDAVRLFQEVERQHPYSAWARRAMLMKAFTHYQNNDYDDAITALDQFIALHPGNKDAPYAYYLKAMCYYERITDVGRDQNNTDNAVIALTDVVRRYPNTEYARDARMKLDLTLDHLAGKEMYVGRFYMRQNKQIAAINRFKTVVADYGATGHVPEALHRLVEAYLVLGLVEEAAQTAAVLGYNYPDSDWYGDSYRLFQRHNLVDDMGMPRPRDKRLVSTFSPDDTEAPALPRRGTGDVLAPPPPGSFDDPLRDESLGRDY